MFSDKLIINAAITGAIPTRADNPAVPITVPEIVADAKRCRDAGAAIIHVHARDALGRHSYERAIYQQIIDGIRLTCPDVVICASTSGRFFNAFQQRSQVLDCLPDLGTLTVGSLNFATHASVTDPDMIHQLAQAMAERRIKPELEFFELGMIDYARDYLMRKGLVQPPLYCNLLLGSRGTMAASPQNLVAMVQALPADTVWSAAGIGRCQLQVNAMAITMGGHVRVGLEDNLWYDADRTQPATNVGLIERVVRIAHAVGRDIATPADVRRLLNLAPAAALPQVCQSHTGCYNTRLD